MGVDCQPFQVTNMGLQLVSIVLLLAGLASTADDQTYEILGKYELKDGSLSKTDVTLATGHGVEMQCAQECSKAACGAFYVQADGLTCSLVPEDSSEGYKDVANLASADFNYFFKLLTLS